MARWCSARSCTEPSPVGMAACTGAPRATASSMKPSAQPPARGRTTTSIVARVEENRVRSKSLPRFSRSSVARKEAPKIATTHVVDQHVAGIISLSPAPETPHALRPMDKHRQGTTSRGQGFTPLEWACTDTSVACRLAQYHWKNTTWWVWLFRRTQTLARSAVRRQGYMRNGVERSPQKTTRQHTNSKSKLSVTSARILQPKVMQTL